ncbi:HEAT repeat domain-containing protein [Streptomyces sp. I05A-00742]|uniref:HEAT repeat domain-containing protein n=1 Tax=Streptomyces sp. I05A-00742 TaxID=2732853 RepID=UPI00201738C1|nr:HEAT repeat domain-containing protein [Streptomyces sp. I05A-00742]
MDGMIAQLVGELDADSSEVAEDAQHALIAMGSDALDELIAAVPGLGRFGQLCAIEVFTALQDPRPGDVLIDLLDSESSTVRQWAAEALADLEIQRAVPGLQRAYEAFRQRGEAPDDSEGVALRGALCDLGACEVVLPPRAAALRRSLENLDPAWPTVHLAEVIEQLAAHGQAVLYFQVWQVKPGGGTFGSHGPGIDWEIDRRLPWDRIVADCRDWALLAAEATDKAPDLVATICWIDASDL